MTITPRIVRPLGTMITYGYVKNGAEHDIGLAEQMNAQCLEILPNWRNYPDPVPLKKLVDDHGLKVHSAHGCWGSQSISARRVDLASLDPTTRKESLVDIRQCLDWIAELSGRYLVVHPGGISKQSETANHRSALIDSLCQLADYAQLRRVTICVENMPPGVHPGSRMADLAAIIAEINRSEIGLALDTGHAHLNGSVGNETRDAGSRLQTTHVHDNDQRKDAHLPPGHGTIDWQEWIDALDQILYQGPIMLECIRYIRDNPESLTFSYIEFLKTLAETA